MHFVEEKSLITKNKARAKPTTQGARRPAGTLSRREHNKLRTRHAILRAASRCFAHAGINATTMDEIAEKADVARGTLFNYFASKAEVVSALMVEKTDGFTEYVLEESRSAYPIEDRIRRVFGRSAQMLEQFAALSRRLLDPSEQGWSTAAGGRDVIETLIDAFTRLLETAPDADALRVDVPPRQLAELLLGIYSGVVHLWRIQEDYPLIPRLDQAARLAAEMVRHR